MKALTQSQVDVNATDTEATGFADRKGSFATAASQYFNTLSSIDLRLRRQINALEEAHIISAEATTENIPNTFISQPTHVTTPSSNAGQTKQGRLRKGPKSSGGLGSLDVGWLNSRNDKVGMEMEAELWERARQLVEAFDTSRKAGKLQHQAITDRASNTTHGLYISTDDDIDRG